MEYQTWTRRANAVAAVKKMLADAPMDYFITSIKATDVSGINEPPAYEVQVEAENPPSEAAALQEILGDKARVKALLDEQQPHEEESPSVELSELQQAADEMDAEEACAEWADAEAERQLAPKASRRSAKGDRKLFCVDGFDPFREGSASRAAWDWLKANPGATFAECKAAGCRMRAISHALKMGWAEVRD